MKKLFYSTIVILIITTTTINNIKAEGEPQFKSITTYEKHEGRRNFWGQDRYNDVITSYSVYTSTDNKWQIHHYHVSCSNPGNAKCRKTLDNSTFINSNGQIISSETIIQPENELLDSVESKISEGIFEGQMSRTVVFYIVNIPCIFYYTINWSNCDEYGNGIIQSQITDITKEISNGFPY